MIGNLLIIYILRLCNRLIASRLHDLIRIGGYRCISLQSADILIDLLAHCRRQHPCIGSRIGHQLLLIQFLYDLQCLIRADLEQLGAHILKLRQVK